MEAAESKVEQSELDTGSEGMWLSLDAILESMGKTCHEQTVASDLTVIDGNIEHVSWVLLILSEVAAPGN